MIPGKAGSNGGYIVLRDHTKKGATLFIRDNNAPMRTSDPWSVVKSKVSFIPRAKCPFIWPCNLQLLAAG